MQCLIYLNVGGGALEISEMQKKEIKLAVKRGVIKALHEKGVIATEQFIRLMNKQHKEGG